MFKKLLLVTLCSSRLLFGMEGAMNDLTNIIPPPRITMDEYAADGGDSWRHTPEEIQAFRGLLINHPLYLQICADPIKHAEEIDTLISESKGRICSHIGAGCYALSQPCMPAIWSAFFAYRSYKDMQNGENCCLNCGMSCFLAVASCGRCSKNAKAMRGISRSTHKTIVALELFKKLKEQEEKKNI